MRGCWAKDLNMDEFGGDKYCVTNVNECLHAIVT
jgi:hypothetical protein